MFHFRNGGINSLIGMVSDKLNTRQKPQPIMLSTVTTRH